MEQARAVLPAVSLFQDLYLCTAGRSACGPGHRFGPDVRLNYLIHYILSGTGRFETDKQRFTLHQGQGFLIEPGQTTCYQADEEDPWTYIWIGFNGTLAPRILESLKLKQNGPVFSCPAALQLEELAEKLLALKGREFEVSLNQHALLLSFFRILAQNPAQENGQRQPEEKSNYHIDKALSFIQANYSNQIHVSDVASYLGISRYHLFRLFTETTGHSPQEYIVSFCLGRARELLTTTDFSIHEIAVLCGYSNGEIFSKAFKKKYLLSPSRYRKYTLEHPGVNPTESIRKEERGICSHDTKPAGSAE